MLSFSNNVPLAGPMMPSPPAPRSAQDNFPEGSFSSDYNLQHAFNALLPNANLLNSLSASMCGHPFADANSAPFMPRSPFANQTQSVFSPMSKMDAFSSGAFNSSDAATASAFSTMQMQHRLPFQNPFAGGQFPGQLDLTSRSFTPCTPFPPSPCMPTTTAVTTSMPTPSASVATDNVPENDLGTCSDGYDPRRYSCKRFESSTTSQLMSLWANFAKSLKQPAIPTPLNTTSPSHSTAPPATNRFTHDANSRFRSSSSMTLSSGSGSGSGDDSPSTASPTHSIEHQQSKKGLSSKQKKLLCPQCGASFGVRSSLNTHLLIHSGEMPHKCNKCNKRFRQRGTLATHMRIHTGEQPYSCPHCKTMFRHRGSMYRHAKGCAMNPDNSKKLQPLKFNKPKSKPVETA